MAAYRARARNRVLETEAIEIRMRATRRMDQMREARRKRSG